MKQCRHAGCNNLVDYTVTYCDKHEEQHQTSIHDTYKKRKQRGGKYHAFYKTRRWRRLSELQRIKQPMCEVCLEQGIIKKADVADHIIEIRDDWSKRYDETNLSSLCHFHHNQKTEKEKAKRKQKK